MIRSFGDRSTERVFNGDRPRGLPPEILGVAARKLDYIHYAVSLNDLRVPPNNRLERLRGDLREYHSIRINRQYRIIFKWDSGNADDVEIIDYH